MITYISMNWLDTAVLWFQHDSTVSAFLDALNVYNMLAPPYASAVLVELHNINNAFCVKILYRNETSNPPYPLVHPGSICCVWMCDQCVWERERDRDCDCLYFCVWLCIWNSGYYV